MIVAQTECQKVAKTPGKGLWLVLAIHALAALGTGFGGSMMGVRWYSLTPHEMLFTLACISLSLLLGLSTVGLLVRKPFGRLLALFTSWLIVLISIPPCCFFGWEFLRLSRDPGYMGDVFMAAAAFCGFTSLMTFVLFSGSIVYLSRSAVCELFASRDFSSRKVNP